MNILHYTESNVTVYKTNKHYMKVKLNNKSFIIIASKIEDLCVILVLIMKKGVALGEKIYTAALTKEIYKKNLSRVMSNSVFYRSSKSNTEIIEKVKHKLNKNSK